jgi:inorganic pyrophosphatase
MNYIISILLCFIANSSQAFTTKSTISEIYKNAVSIEAKNNVVFHYDKTQQSAHDTVLFNVEIPEGTSSKYEARTATGQIILDREVCPRKSADLSVTASKYPTNYGYAPGRFNVDGDPLDMVVIGSRPEYLKMVMQNQITPRKVRIVGTVKMEECDDIPCKRDKDWENDWKILAVDVEDAKLSKIVDLKTVPEHYKSSLVNFFSNYKGLKKGHAQTRVTGFLNKKESAKYLGGFTYSSPDSRTDEISDCRQFNKTQVLTKMFSKLPLKPKYSKKFVSCMKRVFDSRFFKDTKTLNNFVQYSAYQLLVDLKIEQVTTKNSIELMDNLRKKRKKHYRLVGRDSPATKGIYASMGSGNLIYEWVKTKDTNVGCTADFLPQHYEDNPIVDL